MVLLLTIILTELLSNNAVAALLAPLAIELANGLGLEARPFVVAVMLGASCGFAVPTGYQTHLLVYGAGGYRFAGLHAAGHPVRPTHLAHGYMADPSVLGVAVRRARSLTQRPRHTPATNNQ